MQGKVVIITGASRGIGAAAARVFAAAGAKVALLARSGDQVAALAAEIGPAALALRCDIAQADEVDAAVAQVMAQPTTAVSAPSSGRSAGAAPARKEAAGNQQVMASPAKPMTLPPKRSISSINAW